MGLSVRGRDVTIRGDNRHIFSQSAPATTLHLRLACDLEEKWLWLWRTQPLPRPATRDPHSYRPLAGHIGMHTINFFQLWSRTSPGPVAHGRDGLEKYINPAIHPTALVRVLA